LENEISNNLNGGYFLYALPVFESWEDLNNLKIRFTYQNSQYPISNIQYPISNIQHPISSLSGCGLAESGIRGC